MAGVTETRWPIWRVSSSPVPGNIEREPGARNPIFGNRFRSGIDVAHDADSHATPCRDGRVIGFSGRDVGTGVSAMSSHAIVHTGSMVFGSCIVAPRPNEIVAAEVFVTDASIHPPLLSELDGVVRRHLVHQNDRRIGGGSRGERAPTEHGAQWTAMARRGRASGAGQLMRVRSRAAEERVDLRASPTTVAQASRRRGRLDQVPFMLRRPAVARHRASLAARSAHRSFPVA